MLKSLILLAALISAPALANEISGGGGDSVVSHDPVGSVQQPRPQSDMEQERGRPTGIKCPYMGS